MKINTGFWDSSAIVPLCCSQPKITVRSRQLAKRFERRIIWQGTSVEIISSLNRLRENGLFGKGQFEVALKRWQIFRRTTHSVETDVKLLLIAETLPELYGLRALDSFQLAAALVWCKEKPRRRPFICYDIKLAEAAEKAGFTVLGLN